MDDAACGRLAAGIGSLSSDEERKAFLRTVLTPGELDDVVRRWEILELLSSGMPQRAIAERLGVSLCKITRGAKMLKENPCFGEKVFGGRTTV